MSRCPTCGRSAGGICRSCLAATLLDEETGFELPAELGGFHPQERIGRGASGEVWLAFQPGPDRKVALKVFLDPALGGSADRPRFLAEARALGMLDHPNIVPVFATGEEGGFLFIASRWMTGGSLAGKLPGFRSGADPRKLAEWIGKIARAAAHAHRHGLVHRDIKPANILLDAEGEPFLADFGIAVSDRIEGSPGISGTPGYMAPEQARGGILTTAADLYSLGAVLFEGIRGRPPVHGSAEPSELADVDPDLAAICLTCLDPDPTRRYRSADDLAEDLARWLRGEPVSARPLGRARRLAKWARRHPGAATLAAFAGICAATLTVTLVAGSAALRTERNLAVQQERLARDQEKIAAELAARFEEQAYAADMFIASRSINDGNLGMARAMLERHSRSGELRGLEWHVLDSLSRSQDLRSFSDHQGTVNAVAATPDGSWVASAGVDGRVVVRSVPDGNPVVELPRADAPTGALEIPLMSGLMLASPVLREQVADGRISFDQIRMRGRPSWLGELTALAWAPDRSLLATGGEGGFLRIWSMPAGTLRMLLPQRMIRKLAFDGNHRLVCLHQEDDRWQLDVIDLQNQEVVWSRVDVEPAFALHEGRLAWVDKGTGPILLGGPETPAEIRLERGAAPLASLEFSADGRHLFALSAEKGTLTRWETTTGNGAGTIVGEIPAGTHRSLVTFGQGLAVAGSSQSIFIAPQPGTIRALKGHGDEIMALAASPAHGLVFSASKDQTVRWWRIHEPADPGAPAAIPAEVRSIRGDGLAWLGRTPSGSALLGTADDRLIVLGRGEARDPLGFNARGTEALTLRSGEPAAVEWWSAADGSLLRTEDLPWLESRHPALGIGKDHFALSSETPHSAEVRIFRKSDGREHFRLPDIPKSLNRIAISPCGSKVALGIWPRFVRIARAGGTPGPSIQVTRGVTGEMAFSPDGKWLAINSDTNRILLCDPDTAEVLHEFMGHRERPLALAFSPDSRTLVSSSLDGDLRLWHLPTRRPLGIAMSGCRAPWLGVGTDGRTIHFATENGPPGRLGGAPPSAQGQVPAKGQ